MSIANKQNETAMVRLQKARRVLYSQAKLAQGLVVLVTLLLPVAAALCAKLLPSAKPLVAIASLGVSLFDACFFDRWMKQRLKEGAKLQEEFDCAVYEMSWNKFLVGPKVDREDVSKRNRKKLSAKIEATFLNWYSPEVDRLPLPAARIACQRSNVVYDSSQRKTYCTVLKVAIGTIVVGVFGAGLYHGEAMTDFVLTSLVPATPIIIWLLREHNRHIDTALAVERIKGEADKLWTDVLTARDQAPFEVKTRELQDAIFGFRASSPLVFDWLNRLLRKGLEQDMVDAVATMADEYDSASGARAKAKAKAKAKA